MIVVECNQARLDLLTLHPRQLHAVVYDHMRLVWNREGQTATVPDHLVQSVYTSYLDTQHAVEVGYLAEVPASATLIAWEDCDPS